MLSANSNKSNFNDISEILDENIKNSCHFEIHLIYNLIDIKKLKTAALRRFHFGLIDFQNVIQYESLISSANVKQQVIYLVTS